MLFVHATTIYYRISGALIRRIYVTIAFLLVGNEADRCMADETHGIKNCLGLSDFTEFLRLRKRENVIDQKRNFQLANWRNFPWLDTMS